MFFKQLELGPMQNFVYLIGDPKTKQAAVVDPAWHVKAIEEELAEQGMKLTHIFLTHGHYDHINGLEELVQKTDATVCAQNVEIEHFIPEGGGGLAVPRHIIKNVKTEGTVLLGDVRIEMIATPGHTPGSQCLLVRDSKTPAPIVVTGDTLFMGACGRSDFPYSNPEQLYQSLMKLKKLDPETVIYPGHDYGGTPSNPMKKEMKSNPFLLADSLDVFLSMVGGRRRRGL